MSDNPFTQPRVSKTPKEVRLLSPEEEEMADDMPMTKRVKFLRACKFNNTIALKLLIRGAPQKIINMGLLQACDHADDDINIENIDAVKILIKKGADINCFNGHPLRLAIDGGNNEIFNYLLKKGADANINDGEFLIKCVDFDKFHMAEELIKKGVNVYGHMCQALYLAVRDQHFEAKKLFQKYGVDFNQLFVLDAKLLELYRIQSNRIFF
jgi:hypothetical protein